MSIFQSFLLPFSLAAALALPVYAQSDKDIEEAVETIETIVEELGVNAEEIEESIEEVIEEYTDEFEDWAEKYSSDWEEWAEKFEKRFDRWAQDQEKVWEDWADNYSQKWERWAEQLEGEDFDPEQINLMIKKNLEMLGEMPLGDLVEGVLKEGSQGFESAPWDSLQDLQGMLQETIERSVVETERRLAKAAEKEGARKKLDQEIELDFILPIIEEQQKGIKTKLKVLSKEAETTLNDLRAKLLAGEATEGNIDELKKLVAKQRQMAEKQRRVAQEQRKVAQESMRQAKKAKRAATERRKKVDDARRAAEARLARSLDKVRAQEIEVVEEAEVQRSDLRKLMEALDAEEQKIQDENAELEQLRREVEKLRKEVEKLTKKKRDK